MNGFGNERQARPWNFYPSLDPAEQSPPRAQHHGEGGHWKNFGSTSMNAVSLGFVATAILISMFLIMAILEHLFRPHVSTSQDGIDGSLESGSLHKSRNNHDMQMLEKYAKEVTVVMPGQKYPTCIAQPAPLVSCPRQGFRCPSHHHSFSFS